MSLKATEDSEKMPRWRKLLHGEVDEDDIEELMKDLLHHRRKRQLARKGYQSQLHQIIAELYGIGVALSQNADSTRLFLTNKKLLNDGPEIPKDLEDETLVGFVVKLGLWGKSRNAQKRASKIAGIAEMMAAQKISPTIIAQLLKKYTIEGLATRVARWRKLEVLGSMTTGGEFCDRKREAFVECDLPAEEQQNSAVQKGGFKATVEDSGRDKEEVPTQRLERLVSFDSAQAEYLKKSIGRRVRITAFILENQIVCRAIKRLARRPPS